MPASSLKARNAQELSSPAKQSVLGKAESPKPLERSMMEFSEIQQVLGNQALQRMLQPALQRACGECEDLRMSDSGSAPPPSFTSSLPIRLKSGVEALSGIAMDSVRVHYNSPEPAQVQALAYTQGTDIHVAPGQEQHLPHEAWHVVQQHQGRVQPTMQLAGTAINDDSSLEKEADAMGDAALSGARAPAQDLIATQHNDQPTMQRMLTEVKSDDVETPAGVIKNQLKIAGKDQRLPGTQPVGKTKRAREVKATITNATLRTADRKKSGNLATVTAMARAEEMILQGADMKGFYDAGHLVADQLIDGDGTDSFVFWNLAPQAMELNAPTYAQILEEEIRNAVQDQGASVPTTVAGGPPTKKRKGGASASGPTTPSDAEVELTVEVDYPDSGEYEVTVKDLVRRGVISQKPGMDLNKKITFPRRIPNKWKATAQVKSILPLPATQPEFPEIKKKADKGELAEYYVDNLARENPTVGTPFFFTVNNAAKGPDATTKQEMLKIDAAQTRMFEARQWTPAAGGVREEDVISHMAKTFPDFATKDEIIDKLKQGSLIELENKILAGQAKTIVDALRVGLTADFGNFATAVQSKLNASKGPNLTPDDRRNHLVAAEKIVQDMQDKIDAHNKKANASIAAPTVTPFFTMNPSAPVTMMMPAAAPTASTPPGYIPTINTGDDDDMDLTP